MWTTLFQLASDRRRLLGPAVRCPQFAQRRALKTSSDAAVGAVNAGGGWHKGRTS
jgi:hypothetical protein